jgi:HCOMODA/2-hydroxy-3-carboxy-muconic semialdehyde decarboxylase
LPTTDAVIDDLVAANRILANEGVMDAYGHVSARHPERPAHFLMARSRSPELVERDDIIELDAAGEPVSKNAPPTYLERYIHAGIYAKRPDVGAVVHSHARETVPFSITKEPLVPVFHGAAHIGSHIPVWDMREKFGDRTNLLVTNMAQGNDLAARLGANKVVLMRGHGFACAGAGLYEAVRIAVYLPVNAAILTTALGFDNGEPVVLSEGEIETMDAMDTTAPAARRAWEYWCRRAGLGQRS